jgi:hypothetical protein
MEQRYEKPTNHKISEVGRDDSELRDIGLPGGSQALLSSQWEFGMTIKRQHICSHFLIPNLSSSMPQDKFSRYFINSTLYGKCPISRMTRVMPKRSRTSTCLYPRPYPSISSIISNMDEPGNDWFHWPRYELHLQDFVWLAHMQTARRLHDRNQRSIPNCNPVLDRLLEDGTFDCNGDTNTPSPFEEFAMGHLSAMANHLLMWIESLKVEVHVVCVDNCLL